MTTRQISMLHDTIRMERTYDASPARVYDAWRDPKARERWSRPNAETLVVYDKAEFRTHGEDVSRCGEKGDLRFLARVRYLEIIEDTRIVMTESVAESGKVRAASLITIDFAAAGKATLLSLTMQIAALDGPGMLEGYRVGWTAALDNLTREFGDSSRKHTS